MALTDESSGIPATMLVSPTGGYPAYQGNGMGGMDGNGWWIVLLIILIAAGNGFGNGFGGNGGGYGSAPVVINDGNSGSVQRGFDQAAVMSGISGVQSGVQNLATQLCNCCGDVQTSLANGFAGVNATVNSGFANAETAANARQIANMQQAFANQTVMSQGFNQLGTQFADCCCEQRLGTADLKYTIATENCADRAAVSDGIRDVITAGTANSQAVLNAINGGIQSIKDQLCQDKIDAKNDTIAQLRQEVLYARGQASQDVQTARILAGQTAEVDALYNRLATCPVGTMPVYGSQPIFSCNNGCGCGCGN